MLRVSIFYSHQSSSFDHTIYNGIPVKRSDTSQIDNLTVDPLFFQLFGCLDWVLDVSWVGDNGDMFALSHYFCFADR